MSPAPTQRLRIPSVHFTGHPNYQDPVSRLSAACHFQVSGKKLPMGGASIGMDEDVPIMLDPVATNPDFYRVLFENDVVRVLEYHDQPGDRTTPHSHPNSVMYTLSSFKRLLVSANKERQVEIPEGVASWLPAQEHSGENIGDTQTRVIFVELKASSSGPGVHLGPQSV